MKKVFIMTGILTALTATLSHGADTEPKIMLRFRDEPGSYFIKIEAVKDVSEDGKYTSIKKQEYTYTQTPFMVNEEGLGRRDNLLDSLEIPHDATNIRISIRKVIDGKISQVGRFAFIDANKLREGAILCKDEYAQYKWILFGIQTINPFENKSINLTYTLGIDSPYNDFNP